MKYLVFDVETNGLQGRAFAVGAVVVDATGKLLDSFACREEIIGEVDPWVREHVLPAVADLPMEPSVVKAFVRFATRQKGVYFAADCPFPCEAHFLIDCVAMGLPSPYPLVDVASVRFGVHLDPLAIEARLPEELPAHNPLADARQSARLLVEALA